MTTTTDTAAHRPAIMVGLPYSTRGELLQAANAVGAPVLISAGSLHRQRRRPDANGERPWSFVRIGDAAWQNLRGACLDSAGFTAMKQGGYRWTVADYVEFVCTNNGDDRAVQDFPWRWWSAMDYCCEPEIAADRAEVLRRVQLTVDSYREHLECLAYWRGEGINDVPDPMPVLQGRRPEDYLACAAGIVQAIADACPCTCPDGDEWCAAGWHRTHRELPELVGVGSVCRRDLHGPEGLLAILDELHAQLPPHVKLHLFGVKGEALPHVIARYGDRVASVDSMAWDYRARMEARSAGVRNTVAHRAEWLRRWHGSQQARIDAALAELATDTETDDDLGDCCPFCGSEVELDALHGDDRVLVDWLPCCLDAREFVGAHGWAEFRGRTGDDDEKVCADDLNRCTGLDTNRVSIDQGDSLALWRLEIVNPGSRPGWQTDLFADVDEHHRHHHAPAGWKFGIAVYNGPNRVGVAVVGRPVSRMIQQAEPGTWEITRVCTWGHQRQRANAASKLYGAACREAKARGATKVITYTLADAEDGASLRGAGFEVEVPRTKGGSWSRKGRERDDRAPTCAKTRWARVLVPVEDTDADADADAPKGLDMAGDIDVQVPVLPPHWHREPMTETERREQLHTHPDPDVCGCRGSGSYQDTTGAWHDCPHHGPDFDDDPEPDGDGPTPWRAIDLFCGGGGASIGISRVLGVPPAVAINHDPAAIAMHQANHPNTLHLSEDIMDVCPIKASGGKPVDLLWASPDCKHFSRAKGGKPVNKRIRSLAWVCVTWAALVQPRVICMENVPEFLTWGPLYPEDHPNPKLRNKPIPERKGETFRRFIGKLQELGYEIEWRMLRGCDYGAPTTRERLFLVARCDRLPIVWPEPTHGPGTGTPYRTAAECIDWSIPTLSLWADKAECRAWAKATGSGTPRRPLADNTMRRLAAGVFRYVLQTPKPYLVGTDRGVRSPYYVNTRNGERPGQRPRTRSLLDPYPTVTAKGSQGAVAAAFLAKHYTGVVGHGLERPIGTVTARDHHSLVDATLAKVDLGRGRAVAAFLTKYYTTGAVGQGLDEPLHTILTRDRFGLVTVELDGEQWAIVDIGMRMLTPRELATAQGFGADYQLTGTRTEQIARIGNSVCPDVAEALVRAQFYGPQPARMAA